MKKYLAKLILGQYKQDCLFNALEEKGVNLNELSVNNLDPVLDIIGFPQDNSLEYDFDNLNSGGRLRDETKKLMDDSFFCRDWLTSKYYDLVNEIKTERVVFVYSKGIQIQSQDDEENAETIIDNFLDWLYSELEEYEKERFRNKD